MSQPDKKNGLSGGLALGALAHLVPDAPGRDDEADEAEEVLPAHDATAGRRGPSGKHVRHSGSDRAFSHSSCDPVP